MQQGWLLPVHEHRDHRVGNAGNDLIGCMPDALRHVRSNDFDELGLPFCA